MNIAKIIENKTELQSIRQINPCKKIVFTSGCFDILHYGHICHLKESRSLGDLLVVAINSDESIKRLKGNSKPIIPEWQRIRVLQSLGLQSILLDLDATIIKQDTISRFGIVIYIQSTQYGKCYLKFVPQILERYNNEKKIYHTLHKSIMCELVKCYDEFNCLVLINCGNEVSEWDISKEEIKKFFTKVYNNRIISSNDSFFHSYERILMGKLYNLESVSPQIALYVKKAIELYKKNFSNSTKYIIHGDMHRHNLLVLNNTIKAIDPIGYIAPYEIEYARYIGTELELLVDSCCEEYVHSKWQDMLSFFGKLSPLIYDALFIDVVFRMHNATFECDDDKLVNRWLKVLFCIENSYT